MRHILFMPMLAVCFCLLIEAGEVQGGESSHAAVRQYPPRPYNRQLYRNPVPQLQPPKAVTTTYEYSLTAAEAVKVRVMEPPFDFDDKGRVKQYTPEELKTLKGDDPADQKLTGYKGRFSDLKVGDVVQISFSHPRVVAAKNKEEGDNRRIEWTAAGQLQGTVLKLNDGDAKELTVKVTVTSWQQPGVTPVKPALPAGNKITIPPAERQATVIVIQTRAPEEEKPGQKKSLKK